MVVAAAMLLERGLLLNTLLSGALKVAVDGLFSAPQ